MLTEVVQTIGWNNPDDKDTIIKKEQIEASIPKIRAMQDELEGMSGGVGKYVRSNGINTVHDVLVVLRRIARLHGHALTYRRATKNMGNTPVYLYQLL